MRSTETIRGIVIPARWGRDGRPTGTLIAAFDETEYHVEKKGIGSELLERLQASVLVRGFLREVQGRKWIEVKQYELLRDGVADGPLESSDL